jgi:hypothetical protein
MSVKGVLAPVSGARLPLGSRSDFRADVPTLAQKMDTRDGARSLLSGAKPIPARVFRCQMRRVSLEEGRLEV